jgi:hypothetical protein
MCATFSGHSVRWSFQAAGFERSRRGHGRYRVFSFNQSERRAGESGLGWATEKEGLDMTQLPPRDASHRLAVVIVHGFMSARDVRLQRERASVRTSSG